MLNSMTKTLSKRIRAMRILQLVILAFTRSGLNFLLVLTPGRTARRNETIFSTLADISSVLIMIGTRRREKEKSYGGNMFRILLCQNEGKEGICREMVCGEKRKKSLRRGFGLE